jgi:hypothetical protein
MVHDTDIAHSLGINSTLKKGKQQFSSGDTTYDVDAIYNAIKKGKLHLKTKEVETFPMKYPVYDKKYSETVKTDFRKPNGIIVRTESGEEVLIDGNHRMNNAYLKGRKTMKTYYIEDPKQIAKFTKKKKFESGGENKVGGRLSSGKSLKQIAEMHNVSLTHINEELAKGLEVEKEHFADFKERTRVAKDHLVENPNYYTILEKVGLKRGGHIQRQELVEKSKKGDTPARDLNNYNDVMDLEADGEVGGDSGLAFAKGGVVYNPKNPKIEKVTIKDTKYKTVSVIGRNASNVSEFEYLLKDYLFYSSEEEDWIRFYVNDNTRGSYEINLNRGKKNTVKNINPDAINSANIKRVIDANTYLVRNYDWTDFFQSGSITTASNKQYPEYYEFIGKSSQSFTKGKIYKAEYPEDLESRANFIDDTGILNGFSGSNYEQFKPSTKEAYLAQQSSSQTPTNSAKTLTKDDFLNTNIWIGDDVALRDKVIEKLEQMGIPIDDSVGNKTFSKDVFIVVFSQDFVVWSESKEVLYGKDLSKKEIFPKDLGIDIATTTTPKTLTKDELKNKKIWIGDDVKLRDKVKQKLREIGFDFDVDSGKFNADKNISIYTYTDDFVIYQEIKEEFDEEIYKEEILLQDLGIYNVYQTTNSSTSAAKVEKSVLSSVYSLDLAISKLEKASSEVVKKYNTEIYEKSLKFLYDTKSTYELALKFTPESAFVYERLDLMKKLADIQKEIKKIEDMKQGGAYFMLAKILDKLQRGENWKTMEQTQDVITNQIPQSEIEVIIRSQKFKNWFGDWEKASINDEYDNVSKAFTDGKPSVYHHGARRIKYTYREVSNGVLYLAENISYALWFSQNSTAQSEEGNYLTECFVNIKNPIDLTAFYVNQVDLSDIVRYIDAIYPLANIYDFIPSNIALLIKTNQPTNLTMWAWQLIRKNVKFVNYIKENTPYDGFLYYENNPSDQVLNTITGKYEENVTKAVAIFKSHQVKVVDAVLFDGGLDDWRFENGGKIKN